MNAKKIASDILSSYFGGQGEIDLPLSDTEIRRINKRLRLITNGFIEIVHQNRIWFIQEAM